MYVLQCNLLNAPFTINLISLRQHEPIAKKVPREAYGSNESIKRLARHHLR